MKRKALFRHISVVLLLCLFFNSYIIPVSSEETIVAGQSTIVNGSFEYPYLRENDIKDKNAGWASIIYDNAEYDTRQLGWKTTATDKYLEYAWLKDTDVPANMSPHMKPISEQIVSGVAASDGFQFAEVVANELSSLYQILPVKSGEYYDWTVHHRARVTVDTLAFIITNEDNSVNYVKPDKNKPDRFQQILNWLKNNGVTAPTAGNSFEYTVYTTKLKDSNSFNSASSGSFFSFTKDSEHTVEFKICLMSSEKTDWGE